MSAQITLLTLGMWSAEIMWQRRVQDVSAIREGTTEGNTGAMVSAIGKTVNAREMVTKLNLNQLYIHTCNCRHYIKISVNCQWGEWGDFTSCSKTCGGGEQSRNRTVSQEAMNGGAPCVGSYTNTQTCNEDGCPGIWICHQSLGQKKTLSKVVNQ